MQVPLVDLKAQYEPIRDEIKAALERVLDSQRFIIGPEVEALEDEIAAYCQCDYGVGVSSGTDALLVSLMAIEIKPGDEVITTPYTFFATVGAITRLGAKPVFVDIDPLTYNIDPSGIEPVITEKTRAIIPVHLYGQMADMDPIMDVARRHNLYVIEDAAQAIGAEYRGRRAGSIGHLGCFSFFPSKNLGGFGDGGMVTSNEAELVDRVRLLRNHGYRPKYYNKVVGGNFRLDALQAAVLRVKLRYLDDWTAARQERVGTYNCLFREAGLAADSSALSCLRVACRSSASECDLTTEQRVVLPLECSDNCHVYNQFVIRCGGRNALLKHLRDQGVGCEIYYPVPLHLQGCFSELGYRPASFPVSECAAATTLALPVYPGLTSEQQRRVVVVVRDSFTLPRSK